MSALFTLTGSAIWRDKVQGFWSGIEAWGCWYCNKGFQVIVLPNHCSVLTSEHVSTIKLEELTNEGINYEVKLCFIMKKYILRCAAALAFTWFLWWLNYNTVRPVEITSSFCANIIEFSFALIYIFLYQIFMDLNFLLYSSKIYIYQKKNLWCLNKKNIQCSNAVK